MGVLVLAFKYKDNILGVENEGNWSPLTEWIPKYEHPVYLYDIEEMKKRLRLYQKAMGERSHVHYAVKANAHPEILKSFSELGAGVDVVSQGEAKAALANGFKPKDIIFSGVGKTKAEIKFAINKGIQQLNVESPQELERIGAIAKELGKKATVAFRLNPDVNPETHPYIRTGFRDNKFGMDESFLLQLENILEEYSENIILQGVTLHIGSLIHDLESFKEAIEKSLPTYEYFLSKGHPLKTFDVGGGLGFKYEHQNYQEDYEQIKAYGFMMQDIFKDKKHIQVLAEPGRILSGRSGILVTEVQYVKLTPFKKFIIVDTGMHHLLRPSLYSSYHLIDKLEKKGASNEVYDVVGPICESSDVLGSTRNMEHTEQGDLLAVFDTGAYGYSMSSNYNAHGLPEQIIIKS